MTFEKRIATLLVILAFALALVGCGGTGSPTPAQASTPPPSTPPPAAPTASLSGNPSTVDKGASTMLTWQTTNATDVSIGGLGAVQPNGSQSVTPAATTTYTLTAKGAGGTQTAAATVTVTAPPAPPPPPPIGGYTITILQPLPGAAEGTATAINDAGVVVGYSVIESGSQPSFEATMWIAGVPSDLGSGIATAINSSNQVAGSFVDPNISVGADAGGADQGWFWSATTGRIVIGHLPDIAPDSVAAGIDADGTVVGQGFTNGTPAKEGLTWRMDLGINPVPGMNGIFGISSGFMAGQSDSGRAATVVVVEGQPTITDLGAAADVQSMALAVNRLGHVCGQEDTSDGSTHAFFWNQTFLDLGTAGTRYSSALGINDSDQIVGIMATAATGMLARVQVPGWKRTAARLQARPQTLDNFDAAMIWTQATGMINLNTLVTSPDWTLSIANGINDKGEIVGSAFNQAQLNQAYVLEPK